MKVWLLAVITVSVLMSILISLLPDGHLKKTAATGLGFVYLIALLSPVIGLMGGNFTAETLLQDVMRDFAWDNETNAAETDYMDKVISEYRKRVGTECEALLKNLNGYTCSVSVSVEENPSAGNFGAVKSIACTLSESDGQRENIVKPVRGIDRIVIDFRGIHGERDGENTDKKQREAAAAVTKQLVSFLGIEEASVHVIFD